MSSIPATAPALADYRRILRRRWILVACLVAVILLSILADFTLGPSGLGLGELGHALWHPSEADPTTRVIVWDIRLPYALMAVAVGLALGLAGAEMQTILNNPLASPFTLGISSAAAFGASLALLLNLSLPGIPQSWMVATNAFGFALLSAMLLDAVARWGAMSTSGLVLFGIALVFSFNAAVSLVQFVASAEALQGLVFWTLGSLSRFGSDVSRLRLTALLRISILAALAVSFVGIIGFVGLVAPHIARRLFGEDHRFYLPGSALVGGVILSAASIASKNIVPGIIIPVCIVTSLVCVPFFLTVVLLRQIR